MEQVGLAEQQVPLVLKVQQVTPATQATMVSEDLVVLQVQQELKVQPVTQALQETMV
jgi:hypothetical protein